ncbi:recombinase family protein [Saccharibacillus brassicae]|uniref:Recombinase domain-containing protein n=1 Tax=Saccharibacillus brassicae TaxID=2583377 RepID=A0A4Y6V2X5_SACBS|nr:hypothetical protein FFV09_18195 [Saccharibacillus brassicae]
MIWARVPYRGGSAPFGYALVNSGLTNKKGKALMALALDDVQAACVRQIFDWVKHDGYGSGRIAKSLNEQGITTSARLKWSLRKSLSNRRSQPFCRRPETDRFRSCSS